MTILVIEDEPLLLSAIEKKLALHNITVVAFAKGLEGLHYLENATTLPDAIWLDYILPDMDGLTFMRQVRQHDNWSTIAVVVVSNSASEEKVALMQDLGVKQYILKAEHTLEEIIDRVLLTIKKN